MAGRPSTRSSVTRDLPSSPAPVAVARQSQSPAGRRTRSLRSQSIELGQTDIASIHALRSDLRQASVESVESNTSTGSKASRRKKKPRPAVIAPELSMVEEDQEVERVEGQQQDGVENNEEEMDEYAQIMQSPGAASQMSGTTAMTSISSRELATLDSSMILEVLPDLFQTANQVLSLLAPPNASTSTVQAIVKDLRIPGTRRGKLLSNKEKNFVTAAENYTSDIGRTELPFISASIILRKLLGTADPGFGDFRPDAIIHAANIAFLAKRLLVLHEDGLDALRDLELLENAFPAAFVSEYDAEVRFGSSTLLKQSFEVALELRTQIAIAQLKHWRESDDFNPVKLLAGVFLETDVDIGDEIATKGVAGIPLESFSLKEQEPYISTRIDAITESFNQSKDEDPSGDKVDFELLESSFPWSGFLTLVVQWSRSRLNEINASIEQQGGVQNIAQSLIQVAKESDSQLDVSFESAAPIVDQGKAEKPRSDLLPAPDITSPKSLLSKSSLAYIKSKYKGNPRSSASNPQQNETATAQQHNATASSLSDIHTPSDQIQVPKERATEPAKLGQGMRDVVRRLDFAVDNRPNLLRDEPVNRPIEQYVASWDSVTREKNKENRPTAQELKETRGVKRRYVDPQPGAQKIQFDSQEETSPEPPRRKRVRLETEVSESEDEDAVFQTDQRRPELPRRESTPIQREPSPEPSPEPAPEPSPELDKRRSPKRKVTVNGRGSGRRRQRQPSPDEDIVSDNNDDDEPPPTFSSVAAIAKQEGTRARARRPTMSQTRIPWSEHDSSLLVKLIGEYGSSWTQIEQRGGFEVSRGQVGLKDKARNMKVAYLKAGIRQGDLPARFEEVALDKKSMNAVRAVLGNVDSNGYPLD
ncbi:hypothetical protein BP5796_10757 [Coleophoma crateriformis]|uniref:Myb-like domain-containing protein n=1 Tax=Coleophoma crateriformis TaxID=565419 RepID=A0A3D8QR36_9HELO|nr:hypothetical protein BP5796_10757 [Coleophoma crateriformis]